jgi:hypothetical protein
VRRRLEVYSRQTAPLIDYYRNQGKLVEVDGNRSVDEVNGDLRALKKCLVGVHAGLMPIVLKSKQNSVDAKLAG